MTTSTAEPLAALYLEDETAWLERMADLIAQGQIAELDLPHLQEFLSDMARRDRREVLSRLTVLIAHLLKWRHQPERLSRSWLATVESQRQELVELLESGVLRNHAADVLDKAYANGVRQAVVETGLSASTFPSRCPLSLSDLLSDPLDANPA